MEAAGRFFGWQPRESHPMGSGAPTLIDQTRIVRIGFKSLMRPRGGGPDETSREFWRAEVTAR